MAPSTTTYSSPHIPGDTKRIRVMVVDDSALIRMAITRMLSTQPDIELIGIAVNGKFAIDKAKTLHPDIIILDIEMPVMDGITALPHLIRECPDAKVIICSTLSVRGADISLQALSLGAAECVLKPGADSISSAADFQRHLLAVIRSLGSSVLRRRNPSVTSTTPNHPSLRQSVAHLPPKIIAIGSSTGGPNALMELLTGMAGLPVPIVITQHMPKTFTAILAQHIEKRAGIPCVEGESGMEVKPGHAYVAPGGQHMLFDNSDGAVRVQLSDSPPENNCRPAVDPMLRSLVSIYGARILVLIMTGMGHDGLAGGRAVINGGGLLIAQDEKTSVVWGMPGAVAAAGLCHAILPPPQLRQYVIDKFKSGR